MYAKKTKLSQQYNMPIVESLILILAFFMAIPIPDSETVSRE